VKGGPLPNWLKIATLIVPVLFIFAGVYEAFSTWDFQSNSAETTAEVVSVREEIRSSTDSDGFSTTSVSRYPTFSFVSFDGERHVSESSQPASGFVPAVGMQVPVRYYLMNPRWVRPYYGWWSLWAGPVIFSGIGIFFTSVICFAFYGLPGAKRKTKRPQKWGR